MTFSLDRMYPSSPRAKKTTLSSFLASEWAADNGKRSKTDAENEDQMSGKGSIESPGRIDTRWLSGCSLLIDGNLSGTHLLLIATSSQSVLRPQVLVQTAAQRLSVLWSPAALSSKRQGAVAEQNTKKMVYVAVRLACPFVSCVAPRETGRAPPK